MLQQLLEAALESRQPHMIMIMIKVCKNLSSYLQITISYHSKNASGQTAKSLCKWPSLERNALGEADCDNGPTELAVCGSLFVWFLSEMRKFLWFLSEMREFVWFLSEMREFVWFLSEMREFV